MLGFQNDKMADVRRFVVGFIEAACKKDPEFFPKVIINLHMLLNESNANIVKRSIQASTQLYKAFLKWICKAKITDIMESTWEVWCQIKQYIFNLIDTAENDGIRTQCVKFMEMVVICQTHKDQWSSGDEFNIDYMTANQVVNLEQLEEEGKQIFDQLIVFHGTPHISSVNLMATMQTLVLIARQRQCFLSKVIQALEALHANLPPTLTKSQVNSVRKQLRLQLLLLLKHPVASINSQYQSQITQLLNDLGAGQTEINKCLQEVRKRGIKIESANVDVKKIKLEQDDDDDESEPIIPSPKITRVEANTAIDITAEDLIPCLKVIQNVSDLVLVSMLSLPDTMPAHFQASYTPIDGTPSQIKHLARLLSSQLTAAGLGRSF